jgi:hypothetical protein
VAFIKVLIKHQIYHTWKTLVCFKVLAIINKAIIHVFVRFLCRLKFTNHLGQYQVACLLDSMVRICLVLYEIAKLASKVADKMPSRKQWRFTSLSKLMLSMFWKVSQMGLFLCNSFFFVLLWLDNINRHIFYYLESSGSNMMQRSSAEFLFQFLCF